MPKTRFALITFIYIIIITHLITACAAESYGEYWLPQANSAIMLVQPPYYRAGCSAVATGPNEITTVQHCAKSEWEFLTYEMWFGGLPPGKAQLIDCVEVTPLYGYDDGFCWYTTEIDLPNWSPRVIRDCQNERVSSVHHGSGYGEITRASGYAWAIAQGYSYDSPAPGWLRVSMSMQPGSSGAPLWCGNDLIGVYALTKHVVLFK